VKAGSLPRVLVVGAGFAGLNVVNTLEGVPCEVLLVDKRNHHLFQPLLYQVATAALSPADIAEPVRKLLRGRENLQILLGEATEVDRESRTVTVDGRAVGFDWLVLAAGATHAYFGNERWARRAPGLKTLADALEIRRRILLTFEEAEMEEDPEVREAKLTFAVVGGGTTGVEMAGALREIAAKTLTRDFKRVDTSQTKVILLEGLDRVLPAMSHRASEEARRSLEAMGVEVRLNTFVTEMDDEGLWMEKERLLAANVIWAAGVKGAPIAETLGVELTRQGKVPVAADCSLADDATVFVVGDLAHLEDPDTGDPVPGVAQAAIQMGRFVGETLADSVARAEPLPKRRPFKYKDRGTLATIGRARAVADMGDVFVSGFPAWILWSIVHLTFLVGFRNKLMVMMNWGWQWLSQTRGARLITGRAQVDVEDPIEL
jgi:NADH dehydrogenase